MNSRRLRKLMAVSGIALCLGILPAEGNAVVMRWQVDVKGLAGTSWSFLDFDPPPPPVFFVADAHGYFDAEDIDGNGKITLSEVLTIEPMVGVIYPTADDKLLNFLYDPAVGLSYRIDGYHYQIDFGQQAETYSDTSRTIYQWAASTSTTIAPPAPIPEPPRLMTILAGLGLVGWAAGGRRRGWVTGR